MLPRTSVDGGPVRLSRREPAFDLLWTARKRVD
jgi:hypothetical protein